MLTRMPSNTDGMRQLAKQVAMIRWFVVFSLFSFVFGFETIEHIVVEQSAFNWRFNFEVLFF
ncbi:MAG: hypothetical protein Q9P44_11305, partial [Anaerolineae bacterium]|nr:hypothetical protein [Anaerolineae bacterium]